MFIWLLWGDVWVAEKSDNIWADILIKLFLTIFLISFTAVVVLTVMGGIYLYKAIKERRIQAETASLVQKTQAADRIIAERQPLACPHLRKHSFIPVLKVS